MGDSDDIHAQSHAHKALRNLLLELLSTDSASKLREVGCAVSESLCRLTAEMAKTVEQFNQFVEPLRELAELPIDDNGTMPTLISEVARVLAGRPSLGAKDIAWLLFFKSDVSPGTPLYKSAVSEIQSRAASNPRPGRRPSSWACPALAAQVRKETGSRLDARRAWEWICKKADSTQQEIGGFSLLEARDGRLRYRHPEAPPAKSDYIEVTRGTFIKHFNALQNKPKDAAKKNRLITG